MAAKQRTRVLYRSPALLSCLWIVSALRHSHLRTADNAGNMGITMRTALFPPLSQAGGGVLWLWRESNSSINRRVGDSIPGSYVQNDLTSLV